MKCKLCGEYGPADPFDKCVLCMAGTQESILIDLISQGHGWKPLNIDETMRIGSEGKKFAIKRTE